MKCSEYCEREETMCMECERSDEIVDRLGQIEDILGDDYDLERLRGLVSDMQWRRAEVEVPEDGEGALVIVSGKPRKHITLQDAICIASWSSDEGWILDEYPDWDGAEVSFWMPLPPVPEESA